MKSMPYMEWAKLRSSARFNLATSGVENFPLRDLPARIEDLEITGPGLYGYAELRERLVRKTGAPDESLVLSIGTSMANFIALGALIQRGDDVLVEQPTYQPMLHIAQWLGASVRRFRRDPANGWKIDIDTLRKLVRPDTKLIVLSNLHNPSSALIGENEMREIGTLGPRVFVDEVYLEAMFESPQRSSFFLGDNFTITNSLTKAYGLSGLRCGWILTQPELVPRMHALVDLTYGVMAHAAERLSVIALDRLPLIAQRARSFLEPNRKCVNEFLAAHGDALECVPSEFGTCVAPRLRDGRVDEFCDLLRREYETSVVPGHFFEAPEHFRIGLGGPTEILAPGLERIADALKRFRHGARMTVNKNSKPVAEEGLTDARLKEVKAEEFMTFLRSECSSLRMNVPDLGIVRETIDSLSKTVPNWSSETSPDEFAKLLLKRYPELRFEWTDSSAGENAEEPATEKQLAYLKVLGAPIPNYLGIREAADLIDEWKNRVSDAQKRRLNFYGIKYEPNITREQATALIDSYKEKYPESEAAYQTWKLQNRIS